MGGRPWTPQEIEYLQINYRHKPGWQIAQELGRPTKGVHGKAHILGLKKNRVIPFKQAETEHAGAEQR